MWVAVLLVCADEDDAAACLVDLGVVLDQTRTMSKYKAYTTELARLKPNEIIRYNEYGAQMNYYTPASKGKPRKRRESAVHTDGN